MGSVVALVEGMDHVLAREPKPLGDALGEALGAEGSTSPRRRRRRPRRTRRLRARASRRQELRGDSLLVATGRTPRVEGSASRDRRIEAGKQGSRSTRACRPATASGRWATSRGIWPLTYVGKYQGGSPPPTSRPERKANFDAVPSVVFTDPQAASVGAAEGDERHLPDHVHPETLHLLRAPTTRRSGFLTLVSDGERLTGAYAWPRGRRVASRRRWRSVQRFPRVDGHGTSRSRGSLKCSCSPHGAGDQGSGCRGRGPLIGTHPGLSWASFSGHETQATSVTGALPA